MTFAFLPDDGPARLIRYVESIEGDEEGVVVALYDKKQNLLVVNRGLFSHLTKTQRNQLLRTHAPVTIFERAQTKAA